MAAGAATRGDGVQTDGARDAEQSRRLLLDAGRAHFARHGLNGARVDAIAAEAGVNKQLIYYHFGDKDGLYQAVLDAAYADIRQRERELDLAALSPADAMRRLAGFTFDYLVENRHFVALLTDENLHRGVHLRRSSVPGAVRAPLVGLIAQTLERGERAGVFRAGIDPVQFYLSLAGLCYFYHANSHTLSVLFDQDLEEPEALARRRAHVLQFVMGFVCPTDPSTSVSNMKGGKPIHGQSA